MALRRLLGCLPVVALAVGALAACKSKGEGAHAGNLDKRCEQLGTVCGTKDKHVEKLTAECKHAAVKQIANGCTAKVITAYDCYERELCGNSDKVWAIEDLQLLAGRHSKCVGEQAALHDCAER